MIDNDEDFEAALERAMGLIEAVPDADSPADRELGELLEAIAAYRPKTSQRDLMREQVDAFTARLEAFQRARDAGKPEPGSVGRGAGRFLFPG